MAVAGPPHNRRHERQLVMREAVELGGQQNVGDVLVTVDDVETAADVDDTSGALDGERDAHGSPRLELLLQRCRDATSARCGIWSPSVETRDQRRQRGLFDGLWRSDDY